MSRKCRLRSYKSIGDDGKWAAARIEQLEAENEKLSLYKNLADEYGLSVFADLAELQKQRDELLSLVIRYRNETPVANQPHMIAHVADAAIANAKGTTP